MVSNIIPCRVDGPACGVRWAKRTAGSVRDYAHAPNRPRVRKCSKEDTLSLSLLCIGGERDHHLRIPFLLALADRGVRVIAAGSGDGVPFARAGITYHTFRFNRFVNPLADLTAIRRLRELIAETRPDLIQCFDTKPNLLVPLAARRIGGAAVIRTINGLGWLYSSRSALALVLRPVYVALHRLAARGTAMTVFQKIATTRGFSSALR